MMAPALGGRELSCSARTVRPSRSMSASSASQPTAPSRPGWRAPRAAGWRALELFVAPAVAGGVDHRAQVAQVELVDVGHGRLGPVAPQGGGGPGPQVLRHLEQRVRWTSVLPSALRLSFCLSMAWRTAGMPPCSSCSRIRRCSAPRPRAVRPDVPGPAGAAWAWPASAAATGRSCRASAHRRPAYRSPAPRSGRSGAAAHGGRAVAPIGRGRARHGARPAVRGPRRRAPPRSPRSRPRRSPRSRSDRRPASLVVTSCSRCGRG